MWLSAYSIWEHLFFKTCFMCTLFCLLCHFTAVWHITEAAARWESCQWSRVWKMQWDLSHQRWFSISNGSAARQALSFTVLFTSSTSVWPWVLGSLVFPARPLHHYDCGPLKPCVYILHPIPKKSHSYSTNRMCAGMRDGAARHFPRKEEALLPVCWLCSTWAWCTAWAGGLLLPS